MKKLFFCLCAFLIGSATVKAQDKIYRKNGEILKVKILEVSSSEVKYKIFGAADDSPVYILERDRIKKIVYQDGREEKTTVDLKDPEQYEGQKTSAIKLNFLAPLLGFSQVSYERSTGVGKSYELSLAVIGAGKNRRLDYYYGALSEKKRDQIGVAIAAGYKFNKLPDFLFGRTRFTHVMQGGYVKPIVYVGTYKENVLFYKTATQSYVVDRQNVTFGALQIELGKQWVFGDSFVLDIYGGFGYGFDNKKNEDEYNETAYNYLNSRLGASPGFSLSGGLKIGMLLK
jgi:hypothetical protein